MLYARNDFKGHIDFSNMLMMTFSNYYKLLATAILIPNIRSHSFLFVCMSHCMSVDNIIATVCYFVMEYHNSLFYIQFNGNKNVSWFWNVILWSERIRTKTIPFFFPVRRFWHFSLDENLNSSNEYKINYLKCLCVEQKSRIVMHYKVWCDAYFLKEKTLPFFSRTNGVKNVRKTRPTACIFQQCTFLFKFSNQRQ